MLPHIEPRLLVAVKAKLTALRTLTSAVQGWGCDVTFHLHFLARIPAKLSERRPFSFPALATLMKQVIKMPCTFTVEPCGVNRFVIQFIAKSAS